MDTFPNRHKGRVKKRFRIITLIICCCSLFLLTGCDEPTSDPSNTAETATPSVVTTPTATATPVPQTVNLQSIQMINDQKGWALTHDNHVLHTNNATQNWQDVTPATGSTSARITAFFFLNEYNAWLAVQIDKQFQIFNTTDGGLLWSNTPLNVDGMSIKALSFTDSQNGWLLFERSVNNGQLLLDLWSTADGGFSWLPLASTDQTKGTLLISATPTDNQPDISFTNFVQGWTTGALLSHDKAEVSMTNDGGITWTQQALALPFAHTDGQMITLPPHFFDSNHGLLPLYISESGSPVSLIFYSTDDSGQSWHASDVHANLSPILAFSDQQHAWAIGSDHKSLVTSNDSGQHWTSLIPDLTSQGSSVTQLDFTSSTTGWALASEGDTVQLWHTTDGGKSWQQSPSTAR